MDSRPQYQYIYYIKCNDCEHSYIGKTERQCIRRLYEHGAPITPYQHQQQQQQQEECGHESDDSNQQSELRRSSRIKNENKIATTTTSSSITALLNDTNNDKKIDKSSIHQHEKETGHRMNWSNFQIV
ncbi:unnamed protein product [Rotaria sordida]|uniref:Uncharacterized protein n=1 Tax=Rotaria sordida TaxID=392033 RepID=A0A815XGD9_9BILA|nr:unnamed protein product [Rotaria sordida]